MLLNTWQYTAEDDVVALNFSLEREPSELLQSDFQGTILASHREFSHQSTSLIENKNLNLDPQEPAEVIAIITIIFHFAKHIDDIANVKH